MAKIRSTRKLKYDARDTSKEAIVELEVVGFKYLMNNKYIITIKDSAIIEETITVPGQEASETNPNIPAVPETTVIEEVPTAIGLRNKIYTKEEIDQLFNSLSRDILFEQSFTEEFELLITQSLLIITQLDPIYNTESSDWQTV